MPNARRIVVGVDGTAASDAAVRWAVREARLRHATVHLVCAWHYDPRLRAYYAPPAKIADRDEHEESARALLSAAADLARRRLPPARLIAELAEELPARALLGRAAGAEMLVLGTSRPALQPGQHWDAIGAVARACLSKSPCPVIIVTPGDTPARHPDSSVGPGHHMPGQHAPAIHAAAASGWTTRSA